MGDPSLLMSMAEGLLQANLAVIFPAALALFCIAVALVRLADRAIARYGALPDFRTELRIAREKTRPLTRPVARPLERTRDRAARSGK